MMLIIALVVANIIALMFLRKRLLNAIAFDNVSTDDVKRVQAAGWKTVGIYSETSKFNDTRKQYSVNFIFEVEDSGKRRISFKATPPSDEEHLKEHYFRSQEYLIYMVPWSQGSISLEELVTALPKVKTPLVKRKS